MAIIKENHIPSEMRPVRYRVKASEDTVPGRAGRGQKGREPEHKLCLFKIYTYILLCVPKRRSDFFSSVLHPKIHTQNWTTPVICALI